MSKETLEKRLERVEHKVDKIYDRLLSLSRREGVLAGMVAVVVSVGIAILTKVLS